MKEKTYKIVYLRPDGWWVAGEGWTNKEQAREDARTQMGKNSTWKVVPSDAKGFYTDFDEIDGEPVDGPRRSEEADE